MRRQKKLPPALLYMFGIILLLAFVATGPKIWLKVKGGKRFGAKWLKGVKEMYSNRTAATSKEHPALLHRMGGLADGSMGWTHSQKMPQPAAGGGGVNGSRNTPLHTPLHGGAAGAGVPEPGADVNSSAHASSPMLSAAKALPPPAPLPLLSVGFEKGLESESDRAGDGSRGEIAAAEAHQVSKLELAVGGGGDPELPWGGRAYWALENGSMPSWHNRKIDECNVADKDIVPLAYLDSPRTATTMQWWTGCNFWDIPRHNATFKVVFRGRMANGLLQYFWTRIKADWNGWGLHPANLFRLDGSNWSSPVKEYQDAGFGFAPEAKIAKVFQSGCGPHFQQYIYYQNHRCLAQCLFKPIPESRRNMTTLEAFQGLRGNDVVIHYREPYEIINPMLNHEKTSRNRTTPPFEYFDTILTHLNDTGKLGKILIVAAHDFSVFPPALQPRHEIIGQVQAKWPTIHVKGKPYEDHYLARQAPIFIGSFGTFSWTVAYFSVGREIHLPYDAKEKAGSTWNRWHTLFIHDDARIVYHDAFGDNKWESARDVINGQHKFGHGIRMRTKVGGYCDPTMLQPAEGFKELWERNGREMPKKQAPPPRRKRSRGEQGGTRD